MTAKKHLFETLDAMRGLAAILVMLCHLVGPLTSVDFAPVAFVAVDLFFVLSGFVIAHSYEQRLANGMTVRAFMLKRVVRLYPLYLMGLAFAVVVAVADIAFGKEAIAPASVVASAALESVFLPSPFGDGIHNLYPLNAVAWSLMFELLVNFAYAAGFRWWSNRVLAAIVIAGAAGIVLMAASGVALSYGWGWTNAWVAIPRVVFGFAAGVLICRLRSQISSGVSRLPAAAPVAFLGLFLLAAPVAAFQNDYAATFMVLGAPALVMLGSAVEPGRRLGPTYRALGAMSYALYVTHYPLVYAFGFVARAVGLPTGLAIPATVVTAVVTALALDRWYDRPVRRRLERYFAWRSGAAREIAPAPQT